ncbi:MAG TPA: rhodanese-like domain-containing protein [Acidimicrobiales bacterium]|jgi:glyoxylase-like metal-dependent hydrolase (beta-lactamase superfamily II)/rhodanese-related sulfurtransferase
MSLVTPVVDEGLGNTSWLVDLGDDRLAVIDPGRHPGPYLAAAERTGGRVAYSVETHLHADFVTGSRELAAYGATVIAPADGELAWPHRPIVGGEVVGLAGLSLRALATPGHTPEHLAYLLSDGDTPLGVFTGGSLLVGAVARTDLIAADRTEELARALWRSLQEQVLTLPDDLAVYPTHGAGSFCSASAGDRRWSTIGDERRCNPLLAAVDEDAFVSALLDGLGSYPPYFAHLREVNRSGPGVLGIPQSPLLGLDVDELRRLVADGAVLVDTRPADAWAAAHVPGALAIPLRPQFASWLGWLVEPHQRLVFVVGADQDRAELVRHCHQIGFDHLVGELAGGMAAWRAARLPVAVNSVLPPGDAGGYRLLDVRQDSEHSAGHVPGVRHVELGALAGLADQMAEVDAVMCGHGERATTAASLLERAGRPGVAVVMGGPGDWATATGQMLTTG